jgi:hypothetical protein
MDLMAHMIWCQIQESKDHDPKDIHCGVIQDLAG